MRARVHALEVPTKAPTPPAPLVFPLWVLLISVHILLANLGRGPNQAVPLR